MDFSIQEHDGFRFRELSVLDALGIPEVRPLADNPTPEDVAAHESAINAKIAHVLACALVDADGARLYANADAALAGIPCKQWGAAIATFGRIMEASGLYQSGDTGPKNA